MKKYPVIKMNCGDEYLLEKESLINFLDTIDYGIYIPIIMGKKHGAYLIMLKSANVNFEYNGTNWITYKT